MVKKQLLYRAAAATVLGLSLTTGVAAAHTVPYQYYNKHNNGNSSHQMPVPTNNEVALSSTNQQNNVTAANNATQVAQSGKAVVADNWNASDADAKSGSATNTSDLKSATVTVKNSGPSTSGVQGGSELPASGSSSINSVNVSSDNEQNNVVVSNNADQYANTGDAVVAHNGKGGSATSGSATNTSDASFDITVKN